MKCLFKKNIKKRYNLNKIKEKVGLYTLIQIILNISDQERLLRWLLHPIKKNFLFG